MVKPVTHLYGVRAPSLQEARSAVERALKLDFALHESAYSGEYYLGGTPAGEHYQLQPNYHEGEEAWLEPDHRDVPYLLYVNCPACPDKVKEMLERVPLIRQLAREFS